MAFGIGELIVIAIASYFLKRTLPNTAGDVGGTPKRRRETDIPLDDLAAELQPAAGALKVRVVGDTGPGEHGTSFVVEGVCPGLVLGRELARPITAADRATGDPAFDAAFIVGGAPPLVHALLDEETRRLLSRAAGTMEPAAMVIQRGVLTVTVGLSHRVDANTVLQRGRDAVALAHRLLAPADLTQRLRENARRDSQPGVRLRAALALGQDVRDELIGVAGDAAADDATAAAALEALGSAAPCDLLVRVLNRAVDSHSLRSPVQPRAARFAVEALGRADAPEAFARLERLLLTVDALPPAAARAVDALAPAAARALGQKGGPQAEEALIRALGSNRPDIRLAVVPVLSAMGTAAAVEPLRGAEQRGGELARQAAGAIAAIQSRLTDAPGAVSLAASEAGNVSLAPEAGQVSLPAGPGGEREPV